MVQIHQRVASVATSHPLRAQSASDGIQEGLVRKKCRVEVEFVHPCTSCAHGVADVVAHRHIRGNGFRAHVGSTGPYRLHLGKTVYVARD